MTDRDSMEAQLMAIAVKGGWMVTEDLRSLSAPRRNFLVVWEIEAQVSNGGFDQYFLNWSGRLAPYAPGALRAIGANAMAALVDEALALFGYDGDWLDDDARQEALLAVNEDGRLFDPLDTRFYEYPDDLTVLLHAYTQAHPLAFSR